MDGNLKANNANSITIGIVDTMFSRVNMGEIAIDELTRHYKDIKIVRTTIPGIKDLAVECKKLLDSGCDVAMALGMVGGAPIDLQCAHEASLGIQHAKLMTNKHIIEVFVHENEAWSERELKEIFENRIRKHAHNAVLIVKNPEELTNHAGLGLRQGKENEGGLKNERNIGIGLVVSKFNSEITDRMEREAEKTIQKEHAELIEKIIVPGAYDSPLAVKKLLINKQVDCVAVLGAVVKGETKHDEVIVFNVANEFIRLALEYNKPVTLGIIGPGVSWEQAEKRAESYATNAVDTAIKLAKKLRR